jgi:hypothetical protein
MAPDLPRGPQIPDHVPPEWAHDDGTAFPWS